MSDKRTVEFWNGEGLPPIGCYVGYMTVGNGLKVSKVLNYDVKEAVNPEYGSHRVFVHLEFNCRLLHDLISVHFLDKPSESRRSE